MPRAKNVDFNFIPSVNSYSDWTTKRLIDEAANVGRWNPPLSLEWFSQAASRLDISDFDTMEHYDKMAKQTNRLWAKNETYDWFEKKEVWGTHPISRVPLMLES